MKVYTLSGKSGTGKSFQAMNLCNELNIESIIDDGLFIYHSRVEAGMSAKRQDTRVGAIKTALFTLEEHRDSVVSKIALRNPDSILVIGTSDRMVEKIVKRLNLPDIYRKIHIEDISGADDIKTAKRQRIYQGKHVIPVPTLELKRDFAGYFMDQLRFFRGGIFGSEHQPERTVVRPTFSYMGRYYISDSVIMDIANCVASESPAISKIFKAYENTSPDSLDVSVSLGVKKGFKVWQSAEEFQRLLAMQIEAMTAFNVVRVDIEIKSINT